MVSDAGLLAGARLDLSRDLPHVNCTDVVYHVKDELLLVATYGRGLWRLKLPPVLTP